MAGSADISDWSWRNLDDSLCYQTPKVVVIRDRRLGCLYYLICLGIAFYVFGYQILYANEHFPKTPVTGTSRVTIVQPTLGNCDPDASGCKNALTSFETLAYCKEYTGESTELLPGYRKPCVFADRYSISPNGQVEAHLLIPTHVVSEVQQKGGLDNDEYVGSDMLPQESVFVAGIENYMLHVEHTYTRLDEAGASTDVQGYYQECDDTIISHVDSMKAKITGEPAALECDGGHISRKKLECLRGDCHIKSAEDQGDSFLQVLSRHARRFGASLFMTAAKSSSEKTHKERSLPRKSVTNSSFAPRRHSDHHSADHTHPSKLVRTHDGIEHGRRNIAIGAKGHLHSHEVKLAPSGSTDSSLIDPTESQDATPEPTEAAPHSTEATEGGPLSAEDDEAAHNHNSDSIVIGAEPGADLINGTGPDVGEKMMQGVWSLPNADVFTVRKVLELSGLNLDHSENEDGFSVREAGSVITIEAVYWNLHPWTSCFGNTGVEYEYRVTKRPLDKFSNTAYSQNQPDFPGKRTLEHQNGIYVIVKIGGTFGYFSFTYLLILLATSAGLMRMSTSIVDKIAMYQMAMAETYNDAKYQYTERVYDMQKQLNALLAAGDNISEPDAGDDTAEHVVSEYETDAPAAATGNF